MPYFTLFHPKADQRLRGKKPNVGFYPQIEPTYACEILCLPLNIKTNSCTHWKHPGLVGQTPVPYFPQFHPERLSLRQSENPKWCILPPNSTVINPKYNMTPPKHKNKLLHPLETPWCSWEEKSALFSQV